MKVNELRIGIYVHDPEAEFAFVESINPTGIQTIYQSFSGSGGGNIYQKAEDMSPILLTDEWLVKLGFVKSALFFVKDDIRIYSPTSSDSELEYYIFDYGMVNSVCKIINVHQLQNLYFALKGQELRIGYY